jgi:hypothetical protein
MSFATPDFYEIYNWSVAFRENRLYRILYNLMTNVKSRTDFSFNSLCDVWLSLRRFS